MSANPKEHVFKASVTWLPTGQKFAHKEYSRQYLVKSEGKADFIGTAAPAFFGSNYHYNPEDLLVVAVSSCHMLTYLAVCAAAGIEVLSYEDSAEGTLHQDGKIMKFKEIVLKPKIKLAPGADQGKANELHDKAHHACFIANSVNFPVRVESVFL